MKSENEKKTINLISLSDLPDSEDILNLRPSETLQARISQLLEKNRENGLTPQEEIEWEHYQYLEHLVRMAKAKACVEIQIKRTVFS